MRNSSASFVSGMGCLIVLGNLALLGVVIAVAWHFIARYW